MIEFFFWIDPLLWNEGSPNKIDFSEACEGLEIFKIQFLVQRKNERITAKELCSSPKEELLIWFFIEILN